MVELNGEEVLQQEGDELCILTDINIEEFSGDFFFELFKDDYNPNLLQPSQFTSPSLSPSSCIENPSNESLGNLWIRQIEQVLLNEDNDEIDEGNQQEICEDFFADLDFPLFNQEPPQPEVAAAHQFDDGVRVSNDDEHNNEIMEVLNDESSTSESQVSSEEAPAQVNEGTRDSSEDKDDDCNKKRSNSASEDKDDNDDDDPITKKRKRQMRNRDAAVKSRERKKMYVKDLEVKSKYLEEECIRLQRLLQCCAAENHALRFQLQEKAFSASRTKQESAVLLLESLLLGSLLWFLGILGLLSHLEMRLQVPANTLVSAGSDNQKVVDLVALGRARNKSLGLGTLRLFFKSKRCKASRSKMKPVTCFGAVAA